ncbi:MAG TPA: NlpC/P60 family protein, partial [Bacilli bacterium]|nr:NlpC/P60 family protein [Bacilli bacterium]
FTVYDKNNNSEVHEVSISNIKDREPEITDIQVNGILVTLTAKKGENNIAGYYFSKTNTAPTGNENNWVNTSSDTFEVVKIPGTYYAYVKDSKGIISLSNEKIVTIQNEAIYWGNSTIISTSLSSNLEKKGYSIVDFNKLIARSARSAGLYTKDAVATVAATLIITLKNYNIRVPYYWGGKYQNFGANPNWGAETNSIHTGPSGKTYNHLGLDCSGFVVWSYRNAGFNMKVTGSQYFASHYYSTETGGFGSDREIGDLIVSSGHIALIIGKYDKGYIVAENANNIYLHPFTKKNGYRIQNTDITINNSSLYFKDSDYPSGY